MTPNMITACEQLIMSEITDVPVYMSGQPRKTNVPVYVNFYVVSSDEAQPTSLGLTARSRNVGILQATVVGPKDRGAGETGDIANSIRLLLHRRPIEVPGEGWVICKDATVVDKGTMGEEHIQIVKVPYRFDIAAP